MNESKGVSKLTEEIFGSVAPKKTPGRPIKSVLKKAKSKKDSTERTVTTTKTIKTSSSKPKTKQKQTQFVVSEQQKHAERLFGPNRSDAQSKEGEGQGVKNSLDRFQGVAQEVEKSLRIFLEERNLLETTQEDHTVHEAAVNFRKNHVDSRIGWWMTQPSEWLFDYYGSRMAIQNVLSDYPKMWRIFDTQIQLIELLILYFRPTHSVTSMTIESESTIPDYVRDLANPLRRIELDLVLRATLPEQMANIPIPDPFDKHALASASSLMSSKSGGSSLGGTGYEGSSSSSSSSSSYGINVTSSSKSSKKQEPISKAEQDKKSQEMCSSHGFVPRQSKNKDVTKRLKDKKVQFVIDQESHSKGFAGLTGMFIEKQQLFDSLVLPMIYPDLFPTFGAATAGWLFYGPPGTGKTRLTRFLVEELNRWLHMKIGSKEYDTVCWFTVDGGQMKQKYVGESEKMVGRAYECGLFAATTLLDPIREEIQINTSITNKEELLAEAEEKVRCMLFMDEFESLVPDRNQGNGDSGSIVTMFLTTSVDPKYRSLIQVGATNLPSNLDKAVLRRFPNRLFIDNPGDMDRFMFWHQRFCALVVKAFPEIMAKKMNWNTFYQTHGQRYKNLFQLLCARRQSKPEEAYFLYELGINSSTTTETQKRALDTIIMGSNNGFVVPDNEDPWNFPMPNSSSSVDSYKKHFENIIKNLESKYGETAALWWWMAFALTLMTGVASESVKEIKKIAKKYQLDGNLPNLFIGKIQQNKTTIQAMKEEWKKLEKFTPLERIKTFVQKKHARPLNLFGYSFSDLDVIAERAVLLSGRAEAEKKSSRVQQWNPSLLSFDHFLEAFEQIQPTPMSVEDYAQMYLFSVYTNFDPEQR